MSGASTFGKDEFFSLFSGAVSLCGVQLHDLRFLRIGAAPVRVGADYLVRGDLLLAIALAGPPALALTISRRALFVLRPTL